MWEGVIIRLGIFKLMGVILLEGVFSNAPLGIFQSRGVFNAPTPSCI